MSRINDFGYQILVKKFHKVREEIRDIHILGVVGRGLKQIKFDLIINLASCVPAVMSVVVVKPTTS